MAAGMTYGGTVFEGGEGDDGSGFAVDDGYGEVGGFDELEDFGVREHFVVVVVEAQLGQVDDHVAIVGVGASQHERLGVEGWRRGRVIFISGAGRLECRTVS